MNFFLKLVFEYILVPADVVPKKQKGEKAEKIKVKSFRNSVE